MIFRVLLIVCFLLNTVSVHASHGSPKTLIVGSEENFPPFAIGSTDETAGGYTVDLWKEVAKESGVDYKIRVRPWGEILQEFKDGRIDILINIAQSGERYQYTDFSVPHVTVHGAIFVRKGELRIRSEEDLPGKSIIVFKSDLAHEYAVSKGWEKQLVIVNNAQDGLKLLASGQHDAMLLSELTGLQTLRDLKISGVKALDTTVGYSQKFSFGVRKGNAELLAQLNEALALTKATGAYDVIYNKWFGIYETKTPAFSDILPFIAPILIISLIIGFYNFRKRRIERKLAREALRASEQNLRLILDSTGEAIYGIDLAGDCTFCNEACLRILGYSDSKELLGKNMHDLIHHTHSDGTSYPVVDCRIYKAFELEQGSHVDDEVLWRSDGTSFPAEYRSYPQFKDGKTIGAVVTFVDISEAKQLKEKLKATEYKYRFLFESMRDGFASVDMKGRIIEFNNAFSMMIDYTSEETADLTYEDITPVYWHEIERKIIEEQVLVHGFSSLYIKEYKRKDGSSLPVELRTYLSRDSEGQPDGMWAVIRDISERKVAEEQLLRLSQRLRLATSSARLGIWDWNVRDNQMVWDDRMFELYGISRETFSDNIDAWMNGLHPGDRERAIAECQVSLARGEEFNTVFRVCHPDGAVKHIKANGMVILGEDGAAERMIGINVDITDQKQAEEVHLQLEKQLQHAQKLESLGVLAGGIAHDFNNILTIIMGNCTLVQMNPAKTENYITEIEQAAERAAGLCRQMLAYAGKTQFVKARVEIAKLVAETVKMLNATLPQNTAIKFDCFPDVPFIKADASQISQVVLNLIINASEAIGKVQGEILVSLSRVFITSEFNEKDHLGKVIHPGPYACLEVTDNGCGMSDEVCSRMFEPFYTTKFTGRGLGLSAVLGIITTHGGSLQLFSQPGKGTTFKVYWPAQIDNSTPDEPFRQQAQSEPWHGSGTILLVEDEDQIKMLAKTLLNKLGFAVIEASNGKEALESYKQFSDEIVLVITDIGMPVMDGYEMLNELKKMNADLPIIVSSGFAEKDIASRVARQEIAGMINKPYNIEQLRAVLKGVMKDRYQNVTSVK